MWHRAGHRPFPTEKWWRSSTRHERQHDELCLARVTPRLHRQRVQSGQYGNTSEYLRDLIRRDQHDQAKQHLRDLIAEGLESGPARQLNRRVAAELRDRALGPPT